MGMGMNLSIMDIYIYIYMNNGHNLCYTLILKQRDILAPYSINLIKLFTVTVVD